ncbi:MAG: DNA/RNA helicase domain-containing protein [Phycisphaerales bacterium]
MSFVASGSLTHDPTARIALRAFFLHRPMHQRANRRNFKGSRWQRINKADRKAYLKNAYRVLLTRARQGMVIVVPAGDTADPTRTPGMYDATFEYLRELGVPVLA